MSPLARFFVDGAGYDPWMVARLSVPERRFFVAMGLLTLIAAIVCGVGAGYGMWLAVRSVFVAIGAAAGAVLLLWNLFRLFHSGTGFPMHYPIEALDRWWPGKAAPLVFFAFGALFAQPTVLLVMKPVLDRAVAMRTSLALALVGAGDVSTALMDGFIFRARAAWEHPAFAAPATLFLALLVSSPAWLRFFAVRAVRAYEREKWIEERMLVDDAFADAQDEITKLLAPEPRFVPPLQIHYADPPYNTRPLVFGLDLYALGPGGGALPRRDEPAPPPAPKPAPPKPAPPKPAAPTSAAAPIPAPPSSAAQPRAPASPSPVAPPRAPAPPAPLPETSEQQHTGAVASAPPTEPPRPVEQERDDDSVPAPWDDPIDDAKTEAPARDFFEMGRAQAKRAKEHAASVAPFLAVFTGLPVEEVERKIREAPDDARLHRVFPEYKSLKAILLKDAGFARDHGLAPILSVIVQKPRADVDKRLNAAPRDRKLTGVFAPELARRLLGKKLPN